MPITANQLFFQCCVENKIDDLLIVLKTHNVDIHYNNEDAFISACRNGHLEIVKILTTIYMKDKRYTPININICNEAAFKYACAHGKLNIVKYLTRLYKHGDYKRINIHSGDECGFRNALQFHHFDVMNYLIILSKRDKKYKPIDITKTMNRNEILHSNKTMCYMTNLGLNKLTQFGEVFRTRDKIKNIKLLIL